MINMNQICKIVLVKERKTDDYKWVETQTSSQWFKNLFRKNKIKDRYVTDYLEIEKYTEEDLERFNDEHYEYRYSPSSQNFYEKSHVTLFYADANYSSQRRYFDTNKEAKAYFDKLVTFAKQNDVPFLNFYSEK